MASSSSTFRSPFFNTEPEPVQKHSVHTLVFRSLKRTHDMFISEQGKPPPAVQDAAADKLKGACKAADQYGPVLHLKEELAAQQRRRRPASTAPLAIAEGPGGVHAPAEAPKESKLVSGGADEAGGGMAAAAAASQSLVQVGNERMLVPRKAPTMPKPNWHAPWKLSRVIAGHTGWVRCVSVDPTNQFFVTGATDRMIKIWDLATGTLRLSLTGHVSTVRGVAVSAQSPCLISCGEDKTVKMWDLEQNKVVRHYHGHMSAVYGLALHPQLNVFVTCGRDATARVWDMRTKVNVHTLSGHSNTVACVACQGADPQVITGSHDNTIRLWDLAAGKTRVCLTNHKKSIRALALHPTQFTFASGAPDNIKQWKFPDGTFLQNLSGHNAIVNALALNSDGVLVSGADNGSLQMWDWRSGYCFQRAQTQVQPGSIESEAGIFALAFDHSGSRLLTGEADKTIKIYKEDESATEETHPVSWRPNLLKKSKY